MASRFALRCSSRARRRTHHAGDKAMQRGGDVRQGMSAQFRLEADLAERIAIVPPPELKRFLSEDAVLRKWFEALNHSTRSEIGKLDRAGEGQGDSCPRAGSRRLNACSQ